MNRVLKHGERISAFGSGIQVDASSYIDALMNVLYFMSKDN